MSSFVRSLASDVGPRVFAVYSLGYFLSYLVRGVNLPLAAPLSETLGLSAADLGLLTSLYLLAFALCQLPLGLFLDRFGPRRVQMALLSFAAAGAALSALADSAAVFSIGRLMLGIGTCGCLMAGLKAIVVWFEPHRLMVLNGAIYAIGGLGAVVTGAPAAALLESISWRGVLGCVAALIGGTVLLLWRVTPADATPAASSSVSSAVRGIADVMRSRAFWRIAPLAMASQGAYLSIQGLWAGPYLREVTDLSRSEAAAIVTLIGWAMVAGAASSGWLVRRLELRGIGLGLSGGAGMLIFLLVQIVIVVLGKDGQSTAAFWWALFGLTGTAGIIPYGQVTRAFPIEFSGRANTTLNLLVFGSAFAFQYGFGLLVDLWSQGDVPDRASAYRWTWAVLIALQAAAMGWYAWSRQRPSPSAQA